MISQGSHNDAAGGGIPAIVGAARIEPAIQAHIGRQLRAVYNEVLAEPVPDRFLKLLAELARKEAEKS